MSISGPIIPFHTAKQWKELDPHTKNVILGFGAAFIPVVGPLISAGIGLADAKLYYDEGDKTSAGLTATFAMLPLVGSLVLKIPGVKELGVKGMSRLASLIKSNGKLTKQELEIVNGIVQNEKLIKSELTTLSKKISPILKEIESLKPKYIKQFGQQEYDALFTKLLKNEIGKDEFLKVLSSTKKTAIVQGIKGITMSSDEIIKIKNLAGKIYKGELPKSLTLKIKVKDKIEDVFVEFVKEPNLSMASAGYTKNWKPKLTFNTKNLPKNYEEIKRIIYHEVTHIKDPMPQFLKQNKQGNYYLTGSGTQYSEEAGKLFSKAREIRLKTPKGQQLPKEYFDLMAKSKKFLSKYEYAPNEKTANFQMIYSSIPDKINSIIRNYPSKFGKKKALESLDSILNYFKKGKGNIENIIGKRQVEYLNDLKKIDLKQYNDVVKKIFQEVQNVKYQL